jgi:hypothetical protein
MSIMDKIFGRAATQQQPVPNQMPQQTPTNNLQQPPNQGTQQTPQTDANGLVPKQDMSQEDGKGNKQESPMEKFGELWQPPKPDESNKTPENSGFSPEKMMEAAGKVDFSKVLNQEELQKISAGGPDAVTALVNALNKTAQTVFGQSTVVAQKLADKAVADAREEMMAQLPSMVRKQTLNDNLFTQNPAFANPAVAPVIQALQTQLAEKYPKATTAELQTMAQEYLSGVAGIISPPKQTSGTKSTKETSEDWSKYFE